MIAALALLPASALASPIPPGTYDVSFSSGTVNLGLLPPLTLQAPTAFTVDIGSDPITTAVDPVVPDGLINTSVSGYAVTGTVHTTIVSASATLDPVAVSAAVDVSLYASISMTATLLGNPTSGSCEFGSAAQPIALHLTTAQGKAWDATTGLFTLADKTFALPAPTCSPALLGSLIGLITGSTGSGSNDVSMDGSAQRRPDAPPPTGSTPPPSGTPATGGSGGDGTTAPTGAPAPTGSTTRCVVPKLVGKSLAKAKKALRKAHCKFRVVKAKKSKKKRNVVIKQGRKKGAKLRANTVIKLTVSPGPAHRARKHRSR